jgi:predicted SAM-dependent methyltransferase
MSAELERVGFTVELLEYWDEKGKFHYREWDPKAGGMISRSRRYSSANANGELKYTSLIVDAIKN